MRNGPVGLLLCTLGLAFPARAQTLDMRGAWTTDLSASDKIFTTRNGALSFRSGAHRHGRGFILDNNGLRGRVATCKIEWRDGAPLQLKAACSGLVIDTAHFTLTVLDSQRFSRDIPGRTEPEIFRRCWQ